MSFKIDYYLVLNRNGAVFCRIRETGAEDHVHNSTILNLPVNGLIIIPITEDIFYRVPGPSIDGHELEPWLASHDELFTE